MKPAPIVPLTDDQLVVIVPTRHRSGNIGRTFDAVKVTAPAASVIFMLSPGDPLSIEAAARCGPHAAKVVMTDDYAGRGDYQRKINLAYQLTDRPWMFCGADDMLPHPGWVDEAAAVVDDWSMAGVIGTNDLANSRVLKGLHATHMFVARWYADEHGTVDSRHRVYPPQYPHEYADRELVETAMWRGMYAHAHDSIVEHLHPDVGKAPSDAWYKGQPERMREGKRIYNTRRHMWTSS